MRKGNCFCFCYLMLLFLAANDLADASSRLKQPKKTILKAIKSGDGDVVDCVHIYHQPAFDHPLLKDHSIKMKPINYPKGFICNNDSAAGDKQITQVWQLSGECPEGTVPIRRTDGRKNSIVKKMPRQITPESPYKLAGPAGSPSDGHEYAYAYTSVLAKFYGAKAVISAWNPTVDGAGEFSLSQLWLITPPGPKRNTIEVGWHVFPQIYGDSRTRLFVYWTNDNYNKSGCYNLGCSGFVQTSNEMLIGGSITNPGEVTLLVWKDVGQKVWRLNYNNKPVGYWPFALFTDLQDSAWEVQYGGEIVNRKPNGVHTATDMGSGQFAESGNGKASYFRNLQVVNNANTLVTTNIGSRATNTNCYNIKLDKNVQWGDFFYYGGPGRNPSCP